MGHFGDYLIIMSQIWQSPVFDYVDLTGYSYFGRFIIDSRHKGRLPTFMEIQWINIDQVFFISIFFIN